MPGPIDFQTVDLAILLSERSVQQLVDIALEHPRWSNQQIIAHHPKNTYGEQVFTYKEGVAILKRLHLDRVILRVLRQTSEEKWEQTESDKTRKDIAEVFPDFLDYIKHRQTYSQFKQQQPIRPTPTVTPHSPTLPALSPLPRPQAQPTPRPRPAVPSRPQTFTTMQLSVFKQFDRFFSLAKQFTFVFLISFIFFFLGSLLFDTLFQAQTLVARIGMFFAFTALACGMLFFLYSIKYYLTIAVILSFSRREPQERSKRGGIGGFLASLFGISIEVESQDAAQEERKPTISLQYDISGVQLERTPFVSIHVATYNEKRVIDRFLLAATAMEYSEFEVIVADDSTDETVQLLEQWKTHPKVKISHLTTRTGYKGGALQQALTLTDPKAEFILVFDADFIPYPDAISQFLKYFQAMLGNLQPETISSSHLAAVQGYQWHVLNKSENWITRGVRTEYSGSYVIERSGTEVYQGLKQISGSVYMIRKDVLQAIGWGKSITEDFELTLKLYAQGYKVAYTPYIQAPAEAVSTIKRLIRQRMRWAEGHSFNVKRMFGKLLFSNQLTYSEKFEFLYLSPYYLQAFFFIFGTFCWFSAEMIFRIQLPFWTETWGWSLVLTNLFALPLMNMVGLFMEASTERDYLGLFSFLLLSYVVAPFQAFAAVKGFLEKEEGPWFRTPKTGRITDSFIPGRFYRYLKGIFGAPEPGAAPALSLTPAWLNKSTLALAPTMERLPHFSSRKPRGRRWQSKSMLAIFLIGVMFLNYLAFFPAGHKAEAAWYDSNYKYKKQITIDHTKVKIWSAVTGQYASGVQSSSGTTYALTLPAGAAQNDRLILSAQLNAKTIAAGTAAMSVSDNKSNTWTKHTESAHWQPGSGYDCVHEVWSAPQITGGATTVTITYTGPAATTIQFGAAVQEYSGLSTATDSTAVDVSSVSKGNWGSNSANSGNTGSTTAADELVIGGYSDDGAGGGTTISAGSGYTMRSKIDSNGTAEAAIEDKDSGASGTAISATVSGGTTQDWGMSAVVFKLNSTSLSNFPVLISETSDTDLKNKVQNSSGYDIIFTDNTESTKLDHEIEKYVAGTGEIEMWVRIPALSAATDTVIYMYFDNSSISSSQENKTGVWNSNYKDILHLGNGSSLSAADSTSNSNNGTINGATATTGQVDGGGNFVSASNQYIDVTGYTANTDFSNATFTVQAWIKTTSNNEVIASKGGTAAAGGWLISLDPSGYLSTFLKHSDGSTSITRGSNPTINDGNFHLVTVVFTSDTTTLANNTDTIYIDGVVNQGSLTQTSLPAFTADSVQIGRRPSGLYFNGIIDEVQISNTGSSSGWIATEYNNQNSPSTFETFGSLIVGNGAPTIEQQINIFNPVNGLDFNTGGTADGMILIDTANYTGATYYFEIVGCVTSGTGTAVLTYNAGSGSTVTGGSTVTISNIGTTCNTRYRSASFSPTGAQNAYVSSMTGTGIGIVAARIIVVQTNATSINNTVTQIELGDNQTTTAVSPQILNSTSYWKYDSSKYDGTVTVYLEASMNNNNAGSTTTVGLYPASSSCGTQVTGASVSETGTTASRVRSGDISGNLTPGSLYMVCLKTSANTGSIYNAKLVIQQTSSGGLTKTEMFHAANTIECSTSNTSYGLYCNSDTFFHFDPADWAGGTFTYSFLASSFFTDSGGTGYAQLYNKTASSAISGSEVTIASGVTQTNKQSGSLTMPTSASDLDLQIKNGTSGKNTWLEESGVVIDVNLGSVAIEQQIQLSDGWYSSGTTSSGIVLLDTGNYTGATYYFEVDAQLTTSGSASVTLTYNAGSGAIPSGGSTVTISNINSTSPIRYRSVAFTPTGAQNAYISSFSGTSMNAWGRIIVVQTDQTSIKNTVTQLDIAGTGFNDSTTNTSATTLGDGKFWKYDSSKYDGTVTAYFEATFSDNTPPNKATAALYPSGTSCGTAVTGSAITTDTSGTVQRVRSSDISANLSSGTSYVVCIHGQAGSDRAFLNNAKLVIQQTSSGGLAKMELQHDLIGNNFTQTSSSYTTEGVQSLFDPSNYIGGSFTYYYEATMHTTAGTGYVQLYNVTDSSAVSSSELTTASTTDTLVRSSAITLPTTIKTLDAQIKNSGTGTTNIQGSWLIIDAGSLQVPENLFPFLPLIIFLPKLVEFIKRRRKLRLAVVQHYGVRNKVYFSERKTKASARYKRTPDTS